LLSNKQKAPSFWMGLFLFQPFKSKPGLLIHETTLHSHYCRVTGIVMR
jgi:hypothetical protein